MRPRPSVPALAAALAVAALVPLLLVGCGKSKNDSAGKAATSCATGDLNLVATGKLTVGTDSPAFPPWFEDDKPTNGKGFESAVAYAVADKLGFDQADVTWKKVSFDASFAPGKKAFDFDINQVSILPERQQAVDFSDGYYNVNQAVVGYKSSKAATAKSVSELRGLKLGAQIGTTSYDFIKNVIKPEAEPFVYNDNNGAKAALKAKQVDGIVLDLPTAIFVSAAEIPGTAVIGQFPTTGDKPEQFGLVFAKGNSLRTCVNQALAELKSSGELDKIQAKWLAGAVAPSISLG